MLATIQFRNLCLHVSSLKTNRVLRRIFGPKREGVVGGWRRLYNVELCNLYISPYTIRMIRSRRMKWVGNVTHGINEKSIKKIVQKNLKGRDHLEDLGKNGKITSECIFGKLCRKV
jgi:hypothetical protein